MAFSTQNYNINGYKTRFSRIIDKNLGLMLINSNKTIFLWIKLRIQQLVCRCCYKLVVVASQVRS